MEPNQTTAEAGPASPQAATPGPTDEDTLDNLEEMDNDALQAELSRLEGERERRVQIKRIRYLRSGGTLSAE